MRIVAVLAVGVLFAACDPCKADTPPQPAASSQPAATQPAGPATGKPVARFESAVHDFGEVPGGNMLSHAFKVMNAGQGVLNILSVKPSCGCTVAGAYPNELQPGQSGEIPFQMDSKKIHTPQFSKSITVTTNDPSAPSIQLTLKGAVKWPVEVSPTAAGFGRITDDKPQERVVTLTNRTEKPMVANLVPPGPNSKFKFNLIESVPGKEYKLFVNLEPPYTPGTMNTPVTINTNIEGQGPITVNAVAMIPARVELYPSSMYLTRRNGQTTDPEREVQLLNHRAEPVHLLEAKVDDPAIKVSTSVLEDGKKYRIAMTFPPDYATPPQGRVLTVKTDDKEKPELTLTLRGPMGVAASLPGGKTPPTTQPQRPAMTMLGKPAPQFALTSLAGRPVSSATLKENPVTVLNFVAPNCGYCKKQIPRTEAIRPAYEARGVRFVNVMETMRQEFTKEQIVDVLGSVGSKLEVAIDSANSVGQSFKATSYPTMMVLDKNGKVAEVIVGNKKELETMLTGKLDELLKGEAGGAAIGAGPTSKPAGA